jgi:2'-5' RNA ligase
VTRAFVAVPLPEPVLDAVAAAVATIGELPGARWATREQQHVTLQFLGNHADIDAVAAALHDLAVHAGDVRIGGAGAFPSERRARVLWAGIAQGDSLLVQLAAAVGALLAPLGHEPEARAYRPHLTLARWKAPTDVRPVVASLQACDFGDAWRVDEVVVYESVLGRGGAQYVARAVVPLSSSR